MDEKTRLGRGLEEVSQYFLSGSERREQITDTKSLADKRQSQILNVYCPGSYLMQSFFLVNFALELARNQFPVFVWDDRDQDKTGIQSLMKTLLPSSQDQDTATVRLYGLPDIVIYPSDSNEPSKRGELASIILSSDNDCYLLINTHNSLDAVRSRDVSSDVILLTRAQEMPLLQCYAYIKVILDKDIESGISIVFDDVGSEEEARTMFSRLAGFVENKLSHPLDYLGHLVHDECLDRSIFEEKPLMLMHDRSSAKENIVAISRCFLKKRQSQSRQAGET